MKKVSMYIAGGLFNVAERAHNATLEKTLIEAARKNNINLKTTLPQRTAMQRYIPDEERFDVSGIVSDCEIDSATHDYILCNLDGPDADSGTAVELGIARGQEIANRNLANFKGGSIQGVNVPKIITYRTDFRTSIENEMGVNAMLNPKDSEFIYHPCFEVELGGISEYYNGLASKIIDIVQKNFD